MSGYQVNMMPCYFWQKQKFCALYLYIPTERNFRTPASFLCKLVEDVLRFSYCSTFLSLFQIIEIFMKGLFYREGRNKGNDHANATNDYSAGVNGK